MPARVTAPDTLARRDPDPAPTPAPPHVAVVEAARRELGLSYDEIARAIGANASTLHRRRAGAATPSPAYRRRLTALAELTAAVREHRRRGGADTAARAWLDSPTAGVPGIGVEPPWRWLAAGQPERLTALLPAAAGPECPPLDGAARAPLDCRLEAPA